uniref:Uncharacterized protein n=1 Tax=Anguilla anguilla TaxID=7936 RepID=A0A0E9UN10_ANGAN
MKKLSNTHNCPLSYSINQLTKFNLE